MKRPAKLLYTLTAILAALICIACLVWLVLFFRGRAASRHFQQEFRPEETATASASASASAATDAADPVPDGTALTTPTMEVSIDFDALQAANPDVYAWIRVPGTVIDFPVVQSPDDDLYYMDHAADGTYYAGGSIFSQRYNTKTFQDPVTVLYGHNIDDIFAQLNNFADADFFDENRVMYIYTPDRVYEYTIFAAYPHVRDHLLLCNDFSNPEEFNAYFASLNDGISCNYRRDLFPSAGDKVLTLSTCYRQNRMQRYLLQGVLTQEYQPIFK